MTNDNNDHDEVYQELSDYLLEYDTPFDREKLKSLSINDRDIIIKLRNIKTTRHTLDSFKNYGHSFLSEEELEQRIQHYTIKLADSEDAIFKQLNIINKAYSVRIK